MSASLSTLQSICNLALCPSAPDGEWHSAAIAFFRIHRKAGTSPFEFVRKQTKSRSPIMPFGKYKGRTVSYIVNEDPAYAFWVLENCVNLAPGIRTAFEKELEGAI